MSTPKFDALVWTTSCGCGETPTKAFCEVDHGGGDGLIIKIDADDVILVTQYQSGSMIKNSEPMIVDEVELLL